MTMRSSISTSLVSSANGFDDFDVSGLPCAHRVCVGHGIKLGDVFNVYCQDGIKLGAVWRGSLERSLQSFAVANPHYHALFGDAPAHEGDGNQVVDTHNGFRVGDYVKATGWDGEWIIQTILLVEAGCTRDAPFLICSADRNEADGFPTSFGSVSAGDGHVRVWVTSTDLSPLPKVH